jgi:hypothetical protein
MSISSISTSTTDLQSTMQAAAQQRGQNMRSLVSSVEKGDLTTAKTALAAIQEDQKNAPKPPEGSSQPSGTNPMDQAFTDLSTALTNNDTTAAQTAVASLKTAMQNGPRPPEPPTGDSTSTSTSLPDGSTGSLLNTQA